MQTNRALIALFAGLLMMVLLNVLFIVYMITRDDVSKLRIHINENPLSQDYNYFEEGVIKNAVYV